MKCFSSTVSFDVSKAVGVSRADVMILVLQRKKQVHKGQVTDRVKVLTQVFSPKASSLAPTLKV